MQDNEEQTPTPGEWLTTDELAAWLRVSVDTIYKLRAGGRGPKAYRVGKHLTFRRADVEQWLETRAA